MGNKWTLGPLQRQYMYTTVIDEHDFCVKPMNCPGGMLVYKQDMHSYRDLPMRVGEIGLVHRHEKIWCIARLNESTLL